MNGNFVTFARRLIELFIVHCCLAYSSLYLVDSMTVSIYQDSFTGFVADLESWKKYGIAKCVFQALKKYGIWKKMEKCMGKVWIFVATS